MKIKNQTEVESFIRNQVSEKVKNHYPNSEAILYAEKKISYIIEVIKSEYDTTLDELITSGNIHNLHSEDRHLFLYGEESINNRIIELIDEALE